MNWPQAPIGSFCRPKQWPTISRQQLTPSGYPVYGANGQIGWYDTYNHENATVLITCRGATCGTINVCPPKSYVTGNAMALDELDESRVAMRYLVHALTPRILRKSITGTAQPQITRESLLPITVPLPPLDEQRRIAEILDHAYSVRTALSNVVKSYDDLGRSIFHRMFSGIRRFTPLAEVADFFGGTSLPDGVPFTGQQGGALLMKVSDMNSPGNSERIVSCARWSAERGPRAATCPSDSIVLPKRGAAIATNKKRITTRTTILDPNLMGVAPHKDKVRPEFAYYWFRQFDLSSITSGSAVPQLNKQDLAPLPFPAVDLRNQNEFVKRIKIVADQSDCAQIRLQNLDELTESLRSRAFSGQL